MRSRAEYAAAIWATVWCLEILSTPGLTCSPPAHATCDTLSASIAAPDGCLWPTCLPAVSRYLAASAAFLSHILAAGRACCKLSSLWAPWMMVSGVEMPSTSGHACPRTAQMMWQWPSGWCTSMACLSSQARAAVSFWSCAVAVAESATCKSCRALLTATRPCGTLACMYVCTL